MLLIGLLLSAYQCDLHDNDMRWHCLRSASEQDRDYDCQSDPPSIADKLTVSNQILGFRLRWPSVRPKLSSSLEAAHRRLWFERRMRRDADVGASCHSHV